MAGSVGLSLSNSKFWVWSVFLEKTELLIVSWVLSSTFLAFIIWALIKEVVISTTDKALNVICDEWGSVSRLVDQFSICLITFISSLGVAMIHSSNTSFISLVMVFLVVSISWRIIVVRLTLETGIKPTVPLSAIDKENSLESLLYWFYLLIHSLVGLCAIVSQAQPNYCDVM